MDKSKPSQVPFSQKIKSKFKISRLFSNNRYSSSSNESQNQPVVLNPSDDSYLKDRLTVSEYERLTNSYHIVINKTYSFTSLMNLRVEDGNHSNRSDLHSHLSILLRGCHRFEDMDNRNGLSTTQIKDEVTIKFVLCRNDNNSKSTPQSNQTLRGMFEFKSSNNAECGCVYLEELNERVLFEKSQLQTNLDKSKKRNPDIGNYTSGLNFELNCPCDFVIVPEERCCVIIKKFIPFPSLQSISPLLRLNSPTTLPDQSALQKDHPQTNMDEIQINLLNLASDLFVAVIKLQQQNCPLPSSRPSKVFWDSITNQIVFLSKSPRTQSNKCSYEDDLIQIGELLFYVLTGLSYSRHTNHLPFSSNPTPTTPHNDQIFNTLLYLLEKNVNKLLNRLLNSKFTPFRSLQTPYHSSIAILHHIEKIRLKEFHLEPRAEASQILFHLTQEPSSPLREDMNVNTPTTTFHMTQQGLSLMLARPQAARLRELSLTADHKSSLKGMKIVFAKYYHYAEMRNAFAAFYEQHELEDSSCDQSNHFPFSTTRLVLQTRSFSEWDSKPLALWAVLIQEAVNTLLDRFYHVKAVFDAISKLDTFNNRNIKCERETEQIYKRLKETIDQLLLFHYFEYHGKNRAPSNSQSSLLEGITYQKIVHFFQILCERLFYPIVLLPPLSAVDLESYQVLTTLASTKVFCGLVIAPLRSGCQASIERKREISHLGAIYPNCTSQDFDLHCDAISNVVYFGKNVLNMCREDLEEFKTSWIYFIDVIKSNSSNECDFELNAMAKPPLLYKSHFYTSLLLFHLNVLEARGRLRFCILRNTWEMKSTWTNEEICSSLHLDLPHHDEVESEDDIFDEEQESNSVIRICKYNSITPAQIISSSSKSNRPTINDLLFKTMSFPVYIAQFFTAAIFLCIPSEEACKQFSSKFLSTTTSSPNNGGSTSSGVDGGTWDDAVASSSVCSDDDHYVEELHDSTSDDAYASLPYCFLNVTSSEFQKAVNEAVDFGFVDFYIPDARVDGVIKDHSFISETCTGGKSTHASASSGANESNLGSSKCYRWSDPFALKCAVFEGVLKSPGDAWNAICIASQLGFSHLIECFDSRSRRHIEKFIQDPTREPLSPNTFLHCVESIDGKRFYTLLDCLQSVAGVI